MKKQCANAKSAPTPIAVLWDRMGGVSDALKADVQEQNRIRKAILTSLKVGPATVPDIAQAHGLDSAAVMWKLMAMRRYGQVVEAERRGDFYAYRLKEVT